MIIIKIPEKRIFNSKTDEFFDLPSRSITLEHSLMSISKWESIWHKPFLGNAVKTKEELLSYIKCMTLDKNVDDNVYYRLTSENIDSIAAYIDDPMTATWFNDNDKGRGRRIVTSELIYCWMIQLNIPSEFQKWHLNRLLTLIRVCTEENNPNKKKMTRKESFEWQREQNRLRKEKYGTKG